MKPVAGRLHETSSNEVLKMVCGVVFNGSSVSKFFFNLNGNVGPNCPNYPDDVQLVKLGYLAMSQCNDASVNKELRAAAKLVVLRDKYVGAATDPLTNVIKIHQDVRKIGGTKDGHVSVIRNEAVQFYDRTHTYLLTALNFNLRDVYAEHFPRLDLNDKLDLPDELRKSILAIFNN